ncbi:MAG: DUF1800 family protein [Ilumatobacteraceae bacterium]
MASQSDIEHLLRRTEFVARQSRVQALVALTREQAVDDIMAVTGDPGSVNFTETENWRKGEQLTHFWLDRMAHDSPKPMQEKMSFFWHGHFCSEFGKVGSAELMRDQIDLFRRSGLGNLRNLAHDMSTQVAMLRYLDNNQNKRTSPNQNFARECMELFLLGVGNYTEADVEASTAAWTGHTDVWDTHAYLWRGDWHDSSTKQFLGRTINTGAEPTLHGFETIDVILGNGIVPNGATNAGNRGRDTRDVAAEFISRKLWTAFAGTTPSAAVVDAMRSAAVGSNFDITPWVRAMLVHPEFYTDEVKQGLVRSPVEFVVAALVAIGRRSGDATPLWLMEGMGQRPLVPPNVSGWKHNGYFVNASAMSKRTDAARTFAWRCMEHYWDGEQLMRLAAGAVSRTELESSATTMAGVVLRIAQLMQITLGPASLGALSSYTSVRWERSDVLALMFLCPEFHTA